MNSQDAIAFEKNQIEEHRKKLKKIKGMPYHSELTIKTMLIIIPAKTSPSRDGIENEAEPPGDDQISHQEEIYRLRLQALKKVN